MSSGYHLIIFSEDLRDIEVLEPRRHRVHPVAIHVPDHFIRKYQPKEMNNQGFPVGGVSMVNESESDFLPDLPYEDSQPPPPPLSPTAPASPISAVPSFEDHNYYLEFNFGRINLLQ